MSTNTDTNTDAEEIEHQPHSSADFDDMEYVDERGIRIFESEWCCPNCDDDGELMFRPGSKNTCATCFWVLNGQYNDYVLDDWNMRYRDAQRLLASRGAEWGGTPGTISTRMRREFDNTNQAIRVLEKHLKSTRRKDTSKETQGDTEARTLTEFI